MKVEIKILNKDFYKDIQLPQYATIGSAAMDLLCTKDVSIAPGEVLAMPTGLAIWCGKERPLVYDYDFKAAGLIMPRSSLGSKGLVLANTIGVIDEDYQGELTVVAYNRTKDWVANIKAGDRFAQLMFVPVISAVWQVVNEFTDETVRGAAGFGSTGV